MKLFAMLAIAATLTLAAITPAVAQVKQPKPDVTPKCDINHTGGVPICDPSKCPDGCGIFGLHLVNL